MFSTVILENDNSKDPCEVGTILSKTIKDLKQNFETVWSGYKDECDYLKIFHDATIKEFLNKFPEYKCASEIDRDFYASIAHWQKNKDKLNNGLYDNYKTLLLAYQMYFIEAFIRKNVIIDHQIVPPIMEEEKINMEDVIQDLLKKYKKKLENHIFENLGERLKQALHSDLVQLKKQIKQFNQVPLEKYHPTSYKDLTVENNHEKIAILFAEELNQLKFREKYKIKQEEYQELVNKKQSMLQNNLHYVDELIDKIRMKEHSFPEIDFFQNKEYQSIHDQYQLVNQYVNALSTKFFCTPIQKHAIQYLEQTLSEYKNQLNAYKKNLGYGTWIFGNNMTAIFENCQKFIEKSRVFKPLNENIRLEIEKYSKVLPELKDKIEHMTKKLSCAIREKITDDAKLKYYEEVIQHKRKELLLLLTNIPDVTPIKKQEFENEKIALRKAWRECLNDAWYRKNLEAFLRMKRKDIESSKYSTNEKLEMTLVVFALAKKLKKIEKELENPIVVSSHRTATPHLSTQSQNKKWYDRLIDTPWKRAFITSMASVLTIALLFSVWGLIAGITFTSFVLMLGGSAAFASIFTGTFSVSFVGVMSLECRGQCFCATEKKPQKDLILTALPKEPKQEMAITKSNTPFFSKKGAGVFEEKNHVLQSVSKANHR